MDNHNIELLAGIVGNQAHELREGKMTIEYLEKERKAIEGYALRDAAEIDRLREVVGNRNNREAELESEVGKLRNEVERLSDDMKRSALENSNYTRHSKASKLNAEKRKLLYLMKGSMTSGAYTRVINDYKLWLAERGKK